MLSSVSCWCEHFSLPSFARHCAWAPSLPASRPCAPALAPSLSGSWACLLPVPALLPHLSWPGEERQGAQAWGQAAPGAVAEPGGWSSSPAPPMTCGAAFVPPSDSLSQRLTWQNRASGLGTAETLSLGGSSLGRLGGLRGSLVIHLLDHWAHRDPPGAQPGAHRTAVQSMGGHRGWYQLRLPESLLWASRCSKCRFLPSSQQSYTTGTVLIPILEMSRLSHRKV